MTSLTVERVDTPEEMAKNLRKIADMIDEGYTSGYYPYWELKETDEDEDE